MIERKTLPADTGDGGEPVLYETRDAVAYVTFNRPQHLNALDLSAARGFGAAAARALADDAVRVIVVRATGRSFCAGGDIAFMHAAQDKSAAVLSLIAPIHAALEDLARSPKIVIGSVMGGVAGGGMSLALNLDLLVAADDTVFNMAYARIGAPVDCGGSWALPRLVGVRRALGMTLLSESMDAAAALSLGLVNKVVERSRLDEETEALAVRLAQGPAVAQGAIKALMRSSLDNTYAAQLAREADAFAQCAAAEDFSQALDAFIGKRKPVFSGR